jgi:AbrB family looped-hinge helix DNA binding protein
MRATVTSKGQITIPEPIRRKLHLRKGTILDFDEAADHLRAVPCVDRDRVRGLIGMAARELSGKTSAEWLAELRGPVRLPRRRSR